MTDTQNKHNMSFSTIAQEMKINEYFRSLIDPASYGADIPDDLMRPHITRSETITHNLRVTGVGSGIIVLWPNNPTSSVGAHYTYQQDGTLKFDQLLQAAQDFGSSYDYGRKVSQVIKVKSSTVPSGVYALNGTMNAIEYEGTLSEIPDVSYPKILQQTSNPLDKAGGVMVGDGLVSLSLPRGWDQRYIRLRDSAPSSSGDLVQITSDGGDMRYTFESPTEVEEAAIGKSVSFNLDALYDIELTISAGVEKANTSGWQEFNGRIELFGLGSESLYDQTINVVLDMDQADNQPLRITKTISRANRSSEAPVVAARVTISGPLANETRLTDLRIEARCENTNYTGYQNPTAVIAYENVAENSVLTVSGVANYELIPNSNLQRNLKTTFGKNNPAHLNMVKMVLANRDKANIRSLMTGGDYQKLLGRQEYYWNNEKLQATSAASGGFLDFLKTVGNIAAPIVGTLFPGAAPIAGAINSVVQGLSAGGSPVPTSAGGSPHSIGRVRRLNAFSADTPPDEVDFGLNVDVEVSHNTILCCISGESEAGATLAPKEKKKKRRKSKKSKTIPVTAASMGPPLKFWHFDFPDFVDVSDANNPRVLSEMTTGYNSLRSQTTLDISSTAGALFPVVMLNNDNSINTERPAAAYMAVKMDDTLKSQLPDYTALPSYTMGDMTVYNATLPRNTGPSSDVASGDFILLPVSTYHRGRLTTLADAPPVSGGSHQLAVVAANEAHLKGYTGLVPKALFTGLVDGHTVSRVYYMQIKAQLARALGLPMYGNSPYTIRLGNAKQIFNLIGSIRPLEELMAGSLEGLTGSVYSADAEDLMSFADLNPFRAQPSAPPMNQGIDDLLGGYLPPMSTTNPFLDSYVPPVPPRNPFMEPSFVAPNPPPPPPPEEPAQVVADAFLLEGQDEPTLGDKLKTIETFLLADTNIIDDMFTLITLGYADSLRRNLEAQATNAADQFSKRKKAIPIRTKIENVQRSGRLVTEDMLGPDGVITPQILRSAPPAPKKPNTNKIAASIMNIWENNATLRATAAKSGYGLEEIQEMAMEAGFVPSPKQLVEMAETGITPTSQLKQKRESTINYKNYTQMAPAQFKDEIIRMVDEVYESNGGKGPNSAQNNQLVSAIRALKAGGSTASGKSSAPKPTRTPRPANDRVKAFFANRDVML
nr:polyprotein [Birnavirus TM-2022]